MESNITRFNPLAGYVNSFKNGYYELLPRAILTLWGRQRRLHLRADAAPQDDAVT